MGAIILCEFPLSELADAIAARSWVLERVALLAMKGEAELKFVGTVRSARGRPACETIAIRVADVAGAEAIVTRWRSKARFFDDTTLRVLRIAPVPHADLPVPLIP